MRAPPCAQADGGLPLHAGSALLVRHDEERMDVMRAVVVGPEGGMSGYGAI